MQFRDAGRERVTRRIWGAGKESWAKDVGGGGVWKGEGSAIDREMCLNGGEMEIRMGVFCWFFDFSGKTEINLQNSWPELAGMRGKVNAKPQCPTPPSPLFTLFPLPNSQQNLDTTLRKNSHIIVSAQ